MIKEAFRKIKQRKFWQVLVIDVVFFIAIFLFAALTRSLLEKIYESVAIGVNVFILFLYILGLLGIYSFFKYKEWKIILCEKHKIKFIKFYLFNLSSLGVILFLIILFYSLITYLVVIKYQGTYFFVALSLILIVSYISVNILQILKLRGGETKGAVIIRKNILRILLTFIIEFFGLIVLYLFYMLIFSLMKGSVFLDPVFQLLALLLILMYNVFNKIVFFEVIKT